MQFFVHNNAILCCSSIAYVITYIFTQQASITSIHLFEY